jgi:hypothetical protein
MKWSWLPVLDPVRLGDCLRSLYSSVCNIFAHYCGVGQVGERYGLSMQEFAHLLHFMRLVNIKENSEFAGLLLYRF